MARGYVLYEGPSLLDGEKIVAIATMQSQNTKTGSMIQTWILRADQTPTQAVYAGNDFSICGNCPHRGTNGQGRTCYVTVHRGPTGVYSGYRKGSYPVLKNHSVFQGLAVRFGAYGDPAAVPLKVWRPILMAGITRYTGYTHQWRTCHPFFKTFLMASTEGVDEMLEAKELGWRTFRVTADITKLQDNELICPATVEGGKSKQCITCGKCGGNFGKATSQARDIAVQVHGISKKKFKDKPCTTTH